MFEQRLEMLQNPQCFEENRMESVSDHRWYETEEEAIRQEAMKLRYSLNGIWKFLWAPNPASAPEVFEKPEFSCQGWQEIPVVRLAAHVSNGLKSRIRPVVGRI